MSTYTPLASVTLSATATSIVFSGIPQTYTDLVYVCSVLGASGNTGTAVYLRLNADSGNNYSHTIMYGNGTSAFSERQSNVPYMRIGGRSGLSTTAPVAITGSVNNYANTNVYKTQLSRGNEAGTVVESCVGTWRNTTAVTSLSIVSDGGSFASGTTFNLYGIDAQASAQAKATGGQTIIRDSSYWYHVFTSSGTFTPTQALTADCLVIAGGGGSGVNFSGGGGAGGLVYTAAQTFGSNTAYTVTVGAGGPLKSVSDGLSSDMSGSNSNITGGSLSLTAAVGGGGGGLRSGTGQGGTSAIGAGGGSAGGTAYDGSGTSFATGTSGQGNNGGQSLGTSGAYGVGGGGGAGAAGGNGDNSTGGVGGAGSSAYSSWGSATLTGQNSGGTYYYAGGGAGAGSGTTPAGGLGGGGAAADAGSANNGTANTGGGGGGVARSTGSGANGGSGIVIIRYAV